MAFAASARRLWLRAGCCTAKQRFTLKLAQPQQNIAALVQIMKKCRSRIIMHLERFFFINIYSSLSRISPLTSECINTGGMHCPRLLNALRSFEIFPAHYAGEGLPGQGFLHFRARPRANALGQVPLNAGTPSPRGLPLYVQLLLNRVKFFPKLLFSRVEQA